MKGVELTKSGADSTPVWVPLPSIVLIQPYIGFDGQIVGSEIYLSSGRSINVKEDYVKVVELLQKLA